MHDFFARLGMIVLTLLYTRLDRVEITWSKNDLEATGVIAGSVAGENICREIEAENCSIDRFLPALSTCVFSS